MQRALSGGDLCAPPSQECPSCHLSLPFSFPSRPCSARYGRTGLLCAMVCSNPGDVTAPRREERRSCSSRDI